MKCSTFHTSFFWLSASSRYLKCTCYFWNSQCVNALLALFILQSVLEYCIIMRFGTHLRTEEILSVFNLYNRKDKYIYFNLFLKYLAFFECLLQYFNRHASSDVSLSTPVFNNEIHNHSQSPNKKKLMKRFHCNSNVIISPYNRCQINENYQR